MIIWLANVIERGIIGMHVPRYYITISAPWARIIVDAYVLRRVRRYRLRGWLVVVHTK